MEEIVEDTEPACCTGRRMCVLFVFGRNRSGASEHERYCPKTMRIIFVILAAALLVGCHEAGTWKDDPRNWKRVFRAPKPDDIAVVHSWFWRSAHFTYEYEYYIQIQKHADLQKRLLTMNPMKQLTLEKDLQEATVWSQHRPTWFVSKPVAQYEVWIYSNAPNSAFRLLIDRESGDMFLSDTQL
jgi:hypothetical protein